ncbi:MAG: hypothetical protein IIB05_07375 [Bacteroidetes bacterium]|nr:hypothetical protein [Bacteroidota bacterium]
MAKIDIKRTELVWKGKYDEDGKLIPVDRPDYPYSTQHDILKTDPKLLQFPKSTN